jgi:rhamnose utilization protein RhaD (predicted bifunctional aldolase and dehydrogenase)/NAD(P)-dependent dehydrogenase (short-subunit alcohol dehydrogenase family)
MESVSLRRLHFPLGGFMEASKPPMPELRYLKDLWDAEQAAKLDEPELLRYRSNLLGADLRITNFGGGNTSSKIVETDPVSGASTEVLWVKGSGGDLGSIQRGGFATLFLKKLVSLKSRYRGVAHEDEMVDFYPLCTFGKNSVAASIDTSLHAFLPFRHVDHLHPDWAIALAATANGLERLEEFNRRFHHQLVWVPWQRPGFELGLMMENAVKTQPGCDGIVLGGHGLFTWGDTQRQCYLNTIAIIDQIGQFVLGQAVESKASSVFGGQRHTTCQDREKIASSIFPVIRGLVSGEKRLIGNYSALPEVLQFVNSNWAAELAFLGTSCPDHFIRTKIRPLFVDCNPAGDIAEFHAAIQPAIKKYREEYRLYYSGHAAADSPAIRDPNPTVVLVPGVGMFSFGKSRTEARITGEFYVNAIHVMEGATALDDGRPPNKVPQAGATAPHSAFTVKHNYVALPTSEAFRIEYWALEEAKLRLQPPEKEFSRQVFVIVGGGSGIGREAAIQAAQRGAHVVVGDRDLDAAQNVAKEATAFCSRENLLALALDIRDRESIRRALHAVVAAFGGFDCLINTAALFPSSPDGRISDEQWHSTLDLNVTANYLLADEAAAIFAKQDLAASLVFTSSANAVVSKRGSEAYDVSKAAVSHLIRELAVSLAPRVRVNGVSPAAVVKGSTMFPRDRVIASLKKYGIAFREEQADDELRSLLAGFYAQRTLTHQPVEPADCARAILFLASSQARCTTGHIIPVDGGLPEAFLR